jgi:P63C domain
MADRDDFKDESKVAGGIARALALTPERKRAIAKKAAAARWPKLPRATHKGNFREDFGIDVDCYVLDDEQKTAVVSQRGMAAAIGLSERGNSFIRFAMSKSMAPYVGAELRARIEKPLVFQWGTGGAQQPPSEINGYDVTMLVDVCKAILDADSAGDMTRNKNLAKQARVILNASAKAGIKGLVYALAGYDATRQEIIAAFKLFVREEAREYEKEFPDQLYAEWYRLYELPKPIRNKPWKFKHLTVAQVYNPLAQSNGRVLQLTQAQRADSKERHKKLHQFLSEIGVKALRQQLGQLLGIARISRDKTEYEGFFRKLFGAQPDLFD